MLTLPKFVNVSVCARCVRASRRTCMCVCVREFVSLWSLSFASEVTTVLIISAQLEGLDPTDPDFPLKLLKVLEETEQDIVRIQTQNTDTHTHTDT